MTIRDHEMLNMLQAIADEQNIELPMALCDMVKLSKVDLVELYVLLLVSKDTLITQLKDAWDTIELLKHNQL